MARLKASFVEAKNVLLDEVVAEHFVETPYGPDNFIVQIRKSRKNSMEYILLKLSGGETTMFLSLSKDGATQLKEIISDLYPGEAK